MLMFLTILTLIIVALNVEASAEAEIRVVNPKTQDNYFRFDTTTTTIGHRFNVTIFVYDVADLYGYQVHLEYNGTVLNATRAWIPINRPDFVFYNKDPFPLLIFYYNDPTYGYAVRVGAQLLGEVETFSGTGILGIIELEIISEPIKGEKLTCNLDIDNEDTDLLNSTPEEIPSVKIGGYYEYTYVEPLNPYLQVKPPKYQASKLETFNLTIDLNNIASADRLVYIKFSLIYDATLLDAIKVVEGAFLGMFGDTEFKSYTLRGNVTIENTLTPRNSFPEGNGTIATVTLRGIYQGLKDKDCKLGLTRLKLLDDQGNPIRYDPPKNGSYIILKETFQITIDVQSDYWVEIADGRYKLPLGSNVTISGHVIPNPGPDVDITIQVIKAGHYEDLEIVKTDEGGGFSYVWTSTMEYVGLPDVGPFLGFRAVWLEEGAIEPIATSADWESLLVARKEPSEISLRVDPETVLLGRNVTISGRIEPKRKGVDVAVYLRASGEASWTLLKAVKTDDKSHFNYMRPFEQLGTYEIKANWTGDVFTEGAESVVRTVRVVEKIEEGFVQVVMRHLPYILVGIATIIAILVTYFVKIRKS
jgi:hypothetical protein